MNLSWKSNDDFLFVVFSVLENVFCCLKTTRIWPFWNSKIIMDKIFFLCLSFGKTYFGSAWHSKRSNNTTPANLCSFFWFKYEFDKHWVLSLSFSFWLIIQREQQVYWITGYFHIHTTATTTITKKNGNYNTSKKKTTWRMNKNNVFSKLNGIK